jgi:hypothetical protein
LHMRAALRDLDGLALEYAEERERERDATTDAAAAAASAAAAQRSTPSSGPISRLALHSLSSIPLPRRRPSLPPQS